MRTLAVLLFAGVAARGACIDPAKIPVGPRSIETQCSYWKADVAAEGSHGVAAWMTSITSGLTPTTRGRTEGGILDARGRLVSAEQLPMNDAPGYPSVATNGERSLLAWSRNGLGTFVQFVGPDGARIGSPVKVSDSGLHFEPPRALWNGQEWRVLFNEGANVASVRVAADGTLTDRKTIATDAKLADAEGDFAVVSANGAFRLITPTATHPLLAIPPGAVVAVGDRFLAWHAGTIGVQRLPDGNPAVIADASMDVQNIATAGDVVLWSDGPATTHGARVNDDGSTRPLAPLDGRPHAAAATSEGVVVLVASTCFSTASRFLPHGATQFAQPEVVSRATVEQRPQAIVPTPRGHHVIWSEPHPVESSSHLYVTQVEGFQARPPVKLSTAFGSDVSAAPLGDGSVVVWAEYSGGQAPAVLKYARIDADGQLRGAPAEIGATWFVLGTAVAARGEEIVVFSLEHASYAWIGDLWRMTIDASGAVKREQLRADIDGWALDAALASDAITASWYDYAGDQDTLRLTVLDPTANRAFPLPSPLQSVALIGGTMPLVLWHKTGDVHALFPRTGVDVVAVPGNEAGNGVMDAVQQSDGSFNVAVAPYAPKQAQIRIANVTPAGVVTPREEVCFDVPAWLLSMRGATIGAVVTQVGGGAFVARHPPPRRRAMR